MNLQQLNYVIAIYKEGSITKASHALFRAQPNLSSALKELESELNIRIFDRTPNGVTLTPEGEEFMTYATNIVAQVEKLEAISSKPAESPISFGISVSRASYCAQALSKWIEHAVPPEAPMSLHFCETNTDVVIDHVFCADSDLGIIRIPAFYESHYSQMLEHKKLSSAILMEFNMMLVMRKNHPLAEKGCLTYEDLIPYTEVVHGDHHNPTLTMARIDPLLHETPPRRVYVYDRGTQIDLLKTIPGAYMWASPIPKDIIEDAGMILRFCPFSKVCNKDLLIWRKNAGLKPLVQDFADYLKRYTKTYLA